MGGGVWLRAPENPDLDDPPDGEDVSSEDICLEVWVPNALPSVREVSDTETCDVPPLEGPPPKVELLVASVVLCNPDPSPGEDELPDNSSVTFTAPVYGPSAVSMENVTATVNFYQNAFFEGFRGYIQHYLPVLAENWPRQRGYLRGE
ncbi:hypothetical protein B0H10DRAFT_1957091 [Mycena sp. CBHHK59/15]|nr:hypothetical protein B0H10DRAFT_1957091 [Mycena sp. CBHHK59/15]